MKVGSRQGESRGGTLETPPGPPWPTVGTADIRSAAEVPGAAWVGSRSGAYGFRPLRSPHHALSALRRGPADPKWGCKWIIEWDMAACFDAIDHRLLRRTRKKRRQDRPLLDLITRLLRGGMWEEGHVGSPQRGTIQGSVLSPLLAKVFLHACDDWDVRTSRVGPAWAQLAPSSIAYRRRKLLIPSGLPFSLPSFGMYTRRLGCGREPIRLRRADTSCRFASRSLAYIDLVTSSTPTALVPFSRG